MLNKFVKKARHGFTLVEIMIVVLIIGILLAIAIPNFVRARNTSRAKSCTANLKQVDSATEQYLMDNNTTTYPAAVANLSPNYIKTAPRCPSGGTYTIGSATANPTCSIGNNGSAGDTTDDHVLQ